MRTTHFIIVVSIVLSFCLPVVAQEGFIDGVELTTTKAPWTLRVMHNDLDLTNVQAKPDEASAYFMMASASTKLNVSVFIEPIEKCKTGEECRDFVLNLGNPAWGKFEQLKKGKLRDFSYFEFYRPEVKGEPMKILDMYAEYVSQGFWVDVHISKVLYTPSDHMLFENVVNSIGFSQKAGGIPDGFGVQLMKSRSAVSTWLGLWNGTKCGESYNALSTLSKSQVDEKTWIDYCTRMNENLGTNRSRKPIAAAFARPLPDKTDRPLAVLAYHSNFTAEPTVVELIAVVLEKDGTWSVSNYTPQ
jgi:hypothetical protein